MTRNRAALEATLCLNPVLKQRVTIVAAALGAPSDAGTPCIIRSWKANNRGNAELRCGASYTCEQSLTKFKMGTDDCESITTRTLDEVLAEHAPKSIDIAKFDVEGFECNILKGAASLFSKAEYRPAYAQFEMGFASTKDCVTAMLPRVGYELGPNKGTGKDANQVIMPKPGGFDLADVVAGAPEPANTAAAPPSPSHQPPSTEVGGLQRTAAAACLNASGYGFEAANVTAEDGSFKFKMAVIGGGIDWVSGHILAHGFWEIRSPQDVADLGGTGKQLPPPGSMLLDIGGNIGYCEP